MGETAKRKNFGVFSLAVLMVGGLIYLLFGPNLFYMLMVPILWFAGRGIVARASGEPFLRTAARLLLAIFAAVGFLIAIQCTQALWGSRAGLLELLGVRGPLAEAIPASFIAFSGLFVYWLEDACALVPPGVGRTILKALVCLILASFAAIVFVLAFTLAHFLLAGRNYPAWMGWVLLFLGLAGTFYVTWKLVRPVRRSEA
jgi:hypothetical protein